MNSFNVNQFKKKALFFIYLISIYKSITNLEINLSKYTEYSNYKKKIKNLMRSLSGPDVSNHPHKNLK